MNIVSRQIKDQSKLNDGFNADTYRAGLIIGKTYTVVVTGKRDYEVTNRKVKAKLIQKCGSFALFDMGGYKESFTYYDLWKMGV